MPGILLPAGVGGYAVAAVLYRLLGRSRTLTSDFADTGLTGACSTVSGR